MTVEGFKKLVDIVGEREAYRIRDYHFTDLYMEKHAKELWSVIMTPKVNDWFDKRDAVFARYIRLYYGVK